MGVDPAPLARDVRLGSRPTGAPVDMRGFLQPKLHQLGDRGGCPGLVALVGGIRA